MTKYSGFIRTKKQQEAKVTLREFLDIAGQTETDGVRGSYSKSWCGVTTFAEAVDLQRKGYIPKGGVVKLPTPMDDLQQIYMERAMVGQIPDPDAWLRGEPEAMYNVVQMVEQQPAVHLAVMMNVLGGIDGDQQQKHADEVYRCIRHYQQQGYPVTLTALFYNDMLMAGCHELLQVELCREGQVISPATLGSAFHLSFYRVLWFNWAYIHYDNCGGSRTPPEYVDNGTRIVIPSCQFLPPRTSVAEYVADRVKKRRAEMASGK